MFKFFIFILVFLDGLTKSIAKNILLKQQNILGDFVYLKYFENTGIAFGIPLTGIILKIITVVIILLIIYYYFEYEKSKNSKIINLSFILILSGAFGNGYERIFNSKVIDFIGVKYFAIFNLADIYIFLGVFLYVLINFKKNKN